MKIQQRLWNNSDGWKIVGGKELKQEENYPTPEETYEKFSDFK